MTHTSTKQLHLQQPLVYTKELSGSLPCHEAYDLLLEQLSQAPIGTDALLACKALLTADLYSVSCLAAYYRFPDDTSPAINTVEAGSYLFYQMPFAPTEGKHLMPLLNRFATDFNYSQVKEHPFSIRLYKERQFEVTVQFIAPIRTIQG